MKPNSRKQLPAPVQWRRLNVSPPQHDWKQLIEDIGTEVFHAYGQRVSQTGDSAATCPLGRSQEVQVNVVETEGALGPSVEALVSSMRDSLIAVDLEWVPDSSPAVSNPIAMLQLASSSCVLLVRMCRMQRRQEMPAALFNLISNPSITMAGMSWDNNDERKMVSTFGFGRSIFGGFVDAAAVALELGYPKRGLASLADSVLGITLLKSQHATMSNWEAFRLSKRQALYAAQDALVCGGIMRRMVLNCSALAAPQLAEHPASLSSQPSSERSMYHSVDDQPNPKHARATLCPGASAPPSPPQPASNPSADRPALKPR